MKFPKVNPGELRHWVNIQSKATTQDEFGQPLEAWATMLTTRCKIEGATRLERFQNGALTEQVTHVLTTRLYRQAIIKPGMRAVFGPHVYQIQFLDNLLEQDWVLVLYCLELNGAE